LKSERGCVPSTSRSIIAGKGQFDITSALRLVFQTQPRSVKSGRHCQIAGIVFLGNICYSFAFA
jgi:hypothetical protein